MLVEKGADIWKKDSYRWTALDISLKSRNESLIQFLLEQLYGLDKSRLKDILALLYKADKKSSRDLLGRTVLHIMAENGQEDIVRLLLEHGVDTGVRDSQNRTALHLAAECGHEKIMRRLLR